MKTYSPRKGEVERRWFVVDAEGQTLGRLASHLAIVLQGKNKPVYARHIDTGDFVVVVNVDKMHYTSDKVDTNVYHRHTRYPGGKKETTLRVMAERHPDRVLRLAVWGMLPKNSLSKSMLRKLKI
ncbi:MAG: 50S ribosomal protein L13 [Candidatus Fermentibacter sp.]|nr:50S ribosomal protein L13 [Candidatus Fermentibacter sp.]